MEPMPAIGAWTVAAYADERGALQLERPGCNPLIVYSEDLAGIRIGDTLFIEISLKPSKG